MQILRSIDLLIDLIFYMHIIYSKRIRICKTNCPYIKAPWKLWDFLISPPFLNKSSSYRSSCQISKLTINLLG